MAGKPLDPESLRPTPKVEAKPDRAPRQEQRMSVRRLEREVGGLLVVINLGLISSPLRDDALDEAEIALLTQALIAQAEASARFRRYLEAAVKAQGGSLKLVMALALIAARRIARRRLSDEEAQAAEIRIAGLIAFLAGSSAAGPTAEPKPERQRRTPKAQPSQEAVEDADEFVPVAI